MTKTSKDINCQHLVSFDGEDDSVILLSFAPKSI